MICYYQGNSSPKLTFKLKCHWCSLRKVPTQICTNTMSKKDNLRRSKPHEIRKLTKMPNSFHIQYENEPFNRESKLLISTCSMTCVRNLSWYSASTRFSLWISRGATCLMPIIYQQVVVDNLREFTRKWKRNWMVKKKESLQTETRENNSKLRTRYPPIWLIWFEWIAVNHSWTK